MLSPLIDKPVEVVWHQAPCRDGQVVFMGVHCHQFMDFVEVAIIFGQILTGRCMIEDVIKATFMKLSLSSWHNRPHSLYINVGTWPDYSLIEKKIDFFA